MIVLGNSPASLDEIAAHAGPAPQPRVPRWAIGTVHRRSITFFNAIEDNKTFVSWVQSHGMTGDIRIHPARPALSPSTKLTDLDHKTLIILASVEGGTATTSWNKCTGVMSWSDWIGLQPYDKYPESGLMHRIGDCMIEFAPSGAYVEDWRFQASASGPVLGLRLVSETARDGSTASRKGGCVIAGDHAIMSIDRRLALPEGVKAQDIVKNSTDPVAALSAVFDCTVDYAIKGANTYAIHSSTDPRREQQRWTFLDRLQIAPQAEQLIEHAGVNDAFASRQWAIDSFENNVAFDMATDADAECHAWLAREADTLIAPLRKV